MMCFKCRHRIKKSLGFNDPSNHTTTCERINGKPDDEAISARDEVPDDQQGEDSDAIS